MAVLEVSPTYQKFIRRAGLLTVDAFQQLQGVIWCGHPDRHVVQLNLKTGSQQIPVFIKREHRVRWRDRLQSALRGLGLVSKSVREYRLVNEVLRRNIPCPAPIAAGEDNAGRAFLALSENEDGVELRSFLQNQITSLSAKRKFGRSLATTLAHMHDSGVTHSDLYSKHVLVASGPKDEWAFTFLDWQRAMIHKRVSWKLRFADLAALDATLADNLASPPDRMAFIKAYLSACTPEYTGRLPSLRIAAREIRRQSSRLLKKRRIQEMRQISMSPGSQNLIWLDGEALSVTSEFQKATNDCIPDCLKNAYRPSADATTDIVVSLPDQKLGRFLRRTRNCLWSWLWHTMRRKMLISNEYQQAGTIFRLERYRVKAPKLLAVGQRQTSPWRMQSFLLFEPASNAEVLRDWWMQTRNETDAGSFQRKRMVIQRVAECLRSIHDAGCVLGPNDFLLHCKHGDVDVSVDGVRDMRPRRRMSLDAAIDDLRNFLNRYANATRAEQLRFLFSYLKTDRLTHQAKEYVGLLTGPSNHRVILSPWRRAS